MIYCFKIRRHDRCLFFYRFSKQIQAHHAANAVGTPTATLNLLWRMAIAFDRTRRHRIWRALISVLGFCHPVVMSFVNCASICLMNASRTGSGAAFKLRLIVLRSARESELPRSPLCDLRALHRRLASNRRAHSARRLFFPFLFLFSFFEFTRTGAEQQNRTSPETPSEETL